MAASTERPRLSGRRSKRSGSRRRCWSRSTGRARSSCRRPSWAPPARCACFRAGRARPRCAWAAATATRSSRCRTRTTSPIRVRPRGRRGRDRRLLAPAARAAYLAVPEDLRAAAGEPGRHPRPIRTWPTATRSQRSRARCAPSTATRSSRSPPPAGVDPVESFLLGERAGHCELFASAAVLLLRAARRSRPLRDRVPWRRMERRRRLRRRPRRPRARLGGGVRPGRGWVRVDATPPGAPLPRAGHVSEVMDALDYFWNRWVVGYDLGRQLELARRASRHLVAARRARVARRASSTIALVACAAAGAAARRAPLAPPARALRRATHTT